MENMVHKKYIKRDEKKTCKILKYERIKKNGINIRNIFYMYFSYIV